MDIGIGPLTAALNRSVLRVLHALARVLVRHGLPLPAFVELAKRAYVDVALKDFAIPGRKPSVSRAALLTGLTRKEVQRLIDEDENGAPADASAPQNRAARVVAGWVHDTAFHDAGGQPLALPFDGDGQTFSALVRKYSGDVPPRAVLDELLHVQNLERDEAGNLKLLKRVYVPRASDGAKLKYLGSDVPRLIATIDHNLQGLEPPRFQQSVMYDNLPAEAIEEFRELSRRHSREMLELFGAWLAKHDRDTNPEIKGSGRFSAGVGVFYFEENLEKRSDGAPK
jgi:hypothetical protein